MNKRKEEFEKARQRMLAQMGQEETEKFVESPIDRYNEKLKEINKELDTPYDEEYMEREFARQRKNQEIIDRMSPEERATWERYIKLKVRECNEDLEPEEKEKRLKKEAEKKKEIEEHGPVDAFGPVFGTLIDFRSDYGKMIAHILCFIFILPVVLYHWREANLHSALLIGVYSWVILRIELAIISLAFGSSIVNFGLSGGPKYLVDLKRPSYLHTLTPLMRLIANHPVAIGGTFSLTFYGYMFGPHVHLGTFSNLVDLLIIFNVLGITALFIWLGIYGAAYLFYKGCITSIVKDDDEVDIRYMHDPERFMFKSRKGLPSEEEAVQALKFDLTGELL